jgi:UDPglucose 6-dehydrogenase
MWLIGQQLAVDTHEVAATVARSAEGSFNVEYGIRGGSPYDGACLPKDTKGFLGFAREIGLQAPLLTAVDEVNERMRSRQRVLSVPAQEGAGAR